MRPTVLVHPLDEVAEHLLGDVEVGDDPVLERPDGGDGARRAAQHALGVGADGEDVAGAGVDGHHRRLGKDDAPPPHVDEGGGGTQIDGHIPTGEPGDELGESYGPTSLTLTLSSPASATGASAYYIHCRRRRSNPASRNSRASRHSGNPTTLLYSPRTSETNVPASPWTP